MKSLLTVLTILTAPAFAAPTITFQSSTKPPEVVRIAVELTATKIIEVPALNIAHIHEPVFNFSEDIGYGSVVLPNLVVDGENFTYVSAYICKEFGYGRPKAVQGSRPVLGDVFMAFYGNPNLPTNKGLGIASAKGATTTPANLTCEFKKPQEGVARDLSIDATAAYDLGH